MTSTANERSGLLVRFTNGLMRWRTPLFVTTVIALVVAWPIARRLSFEQSVESLYSPDDPHLLDYLASKSTFGGDEFVIVAFRDPQLFEPGGETPRPASMERIRKFSRELGRIGGVNPDSTQSLGDSLPDVFLFPVNDVISLFEGILVDKERQHTAIVLRLLSLDKTNVPRAETIRRVREHAARFEREQNLPTFVVGEPVQVHDMFYYVEEDGRVLFRASLAILAIVILTIFRSARWVALPMLVVLATVVTTEATLVLSGLRLSMVSSMLNALVTIMGIATITHMTVYYREFRRSMSREDAFRRTFVQLIPAVFWVTATTAGGFAALLSAHNTPTQSFGLMMALATMLLLVLGATLLPGGVLLGSIDPDPRSTPGEARLVASLNRTAGWIERHPRSLSLGILLFTGFAILGFWRLRVETDFSKNFRDSSPIVQSLNFVESHLGGAGSWEVNFPAPKEMSPEFVTRVARLAKRLRTETIENGEPQITKVIALSDGIDIIPPHPTPEKYRFLGMRLHALKLLQPEFVPGLYNPEKERMRIVLRARERTPSEVKLRLIDQVGRIAREEFPPDEFPGKSPASTTGLFVLLAYLIESMLGDQTTSFLWSAAGMLMMMALAFRSIRVALITMVPNLFPIVCVVGVMGWLGLPINIATAMIAAVSIGLTIDASIFYLDEYFRLRREGVGIDEAIRETNRGVGQALVLSNFALIIGFSVLTLSHFIPLIYFGALVDVAMIGGLVGNIVLLPLLLKWIDRPTRTEVPSTQVIATAPEQRAGLTSD